MDFLIGEETEFFDFISRLTEKDKIAILAHNDLDGVASAVIASKILGKIDFLAFLGYAPGIYKNIVEELKKKKINKILCLDLVIDNSDLDMKEVEKIAEILVIDHHPVFKDLNSVRTRVLKTESYYPASAICYYLFSKVQQVPNWIAALGIVADKPDKYNKENADEVFSDFKLGNKVSISEYFRKMELAILYFGGDRLKEVFDMLNNARFPSELNLDQYTKKIEKKLEEYKKRFKEEKEEHGELIIFYFESNSKINPIFINELSCETPNRTVVTIQKDKQKSFLNISSRRQDKKVDCNEMMRKAILVIPNSNAGGHAAAAGGQILPEYLDQFKENLIKEHNLLRK
jgi:single-stranded DNA-specific DHH superfamily exonuclease